MSQKGQGLVLLKSLTLYPAFDHFNGFEPAQMKPALNLSQLLDEEPEDINELDKCFL